jgi:hypothetical protein
VREEPRLKGEIKRRRRRRRVARHELSFGLIRISRSLLKEAQASFPQDGYVVYVFA